MDSNFFVSLNLKIDSWLSAVKEAGDSIKGLGDKITDTGKKEPFNNFGAKFDEIGDKADKLGTVTEKTAKKFDLFAKSGAIMSKLDDVTGGYASKIADLGSAFSKSFKAGVAGANALKVAIISTGIGALVVALAAIVAYWDEIKALVTGVSSELRDQQKVLNDELDTQQKKLGLLNASDNILKLQGKSQTQINNLKLVELKTLLKIQVQQYENLKASLKSAEAQEKVYTDFLEGIIDGAANVGKILLGVFESVGSGVVTLFKFVTDKVLVVLYGLAQVTDKILGTNLSDKVKGLGDSLNKLEFPNLTKNVDEFVDKFKKAVIPKDFLTEDLKKEFDEINLALTKTENTIAGLELANLKIAREEAEKLKEALSRPKDLIAFNFNEGLQTLDIKANLSLNTDGFKEQFGQALAVVNEEAILFQERIRLLNEDISTTIKDGLTSSLSGIGEAIGNAISSGTNILDAVGASLLSSLGGILVDLGKMAIQVGIGLLGVELALKSLNPALAIAGGVALVALGSIFKKGASSIASGSGASSSGGGSSSSGGGVRSTFSGGATSGGFSNARVVFEIGGDKLIGVLNNTANGYNRVGDNDGLIAD